MRSAFSALALLASTASAARFIIHIPSTPHVNPSTLSSSTHVTLQSHGAPIDARLTRSNSFSFANVPAGSYLATIHSRDVLFEPLRIDVSVEEAVEGSGEKREVIRAWQTFVGNEWENKGESRGEGGNGVVVEARPLAPKNYFQERSGFSPLSFLKNPMMLMAIASMVLVFGMPYLMENMDPETKAEFEEMQKSSPLAAGGNPAEKLQNFDLASWMAGKTDTGASSAREKSPNAREKKRA